MTRTLKPIFCGLIIAGLTAGAAVAATATPRTTVNLDNARASGPAATTSPRAKQPVIMQRNSARSARNVAARTATTPNRSTTSTVSRAARIIGDAGSTILRHALGIPRSATNSKMISRSAAPAVARVAVSGGASRARATAVFSDISKLGEGYNSCRETYNTCMDQFCAGANETYRRCFCSNTFRTLRDKEEALDAATAMLASFEDNNLNAVNKTAEEVTAMYSATEGEAAIKKDTSASAALLNDIGDLLSGKKKASDTNSMKSLTGLSIDFSADLGDIWGGGNSSNSLFGNNNGVDLSTLEGIELYTQAHNQCMQLVSNSCENSAVKNMVKSAYNILVVQDCNAYQKKLDAKTEQVKQTVRTAEKYLREARLDEYRSHNSADVNECMDKVETAILQPTACGPDFVKCLDYSGVYINSTTGDPIYSARLFGLNEIIQLDGSSDVLSQNPEFNKFLDSKRMYAKTYLDTCRYISDTVWSEFKRNALIKISQAQDEKLEEVKMSCVSTMKECYDTQSGALKSFDDTTAQASGALAARAAKDMCVDKVAACAALYAKEGDEVCDVDIKTGKIRNAERCGLASLRNFVDTVDDTRIAEGCGAAIESYLKDLCTPTSGDEGYPWSCRLRKFMDSAGGKGPKTFNDISDIDSFAHQTGNNLSLSQMVINYAFENCGVKEGSEYRLDESRSRREISQQLENLYYDLGNQIGDKCGAASGLWIDGSDQTAGGLSKGNAYVESFYSVNFGKSHNQANVDYGIDSWGYCVENSVKVRCEAINTKMGNKDDAKYDESTGKCIFSVDFYKSQCEEANGLWDDGRCYIKNSTN